MVGFRNIIAHEHGFNKRLVFGILKNQLEDVATSSIGYALYLGVRGTSILCQLNDLDRSLHMIFWIKLDLSSKMSDAPHVAMKKSTGSKPAYTYFFLMSIVFLFTCLNSTLWLRNRGAIVDPLVVQ